MFDDITLMLSKIKSQRPLIMNITNYVTANFVANGLLSLGASPLMTQALLEIDELMVISNAVVINIGTLDSAFITLCEKVCSTANLLKKPIILDPVGAGASRYRTDVCLKLLEHYNVSILKGNASEIMALSGMSPNNTKGVDSNNSTYDALEGAQYLASHYPHIVIGISGEIDAVVDKNTTQFFDRGSRLMPLVTGSGCLLTAIIGAFSAIHSNYSTAVAAAIKFYGVCGEIAEKKANGPGTFMVEFLDALARLPEKNDYEKK